MNRRRQDFYTRLLAAALLLSQTLPFVPRRPELVGAAITLFGVVPIRRAQDIVNSLAGKEEKEEKAEL